jgi:hypothetical protein
MLGTSLAMLVFVLNEQGIFVNRYDFEVNFLDPWNWGAGPRKLLPPSILTMHKLLMCLSSLCQVTSAWLSPSSDFLDFCVLHLNFMWLPSSSLILC